MKCRIPPRHVLSKKQRKACDEYFNEKSVTDTNRLFKLFCYCLNVDFGFGKKRLLRLLGAVQEVAEESKNDEVFWEHIDRYVIGRMKLEFKEEEYEDILKDFKEGH